MDVVQNERNKKKVPKWPTIVEFWLPSNYGVFDLLGVVRKWLTTNP